MRQREKKNETNSSSERKEGQNARQRDGEREGKNRKLIEGKVSKGD